MNIFSDASSTLATSTKRKSVELYFARNELAFFIYLNSEINFIIAIFIFAFFSFKSVGKYDATLADNLSVAITGHFLIYFLLDFHLKVS